MMIGSSGNDFVFSRICMCLTTSYPHCIGRYTGFLYLYSGKLLKNRIEIIFETV
jgi:hypothetical protein